MVTYRKILRELKLLIPVDDGEEYIVKELSKKLEEGIPDEVAYDELELENFVNKLNNSIVVAVWNTDLELWELFTIKSKNIELQNRKNLLKTWTAVLDNKTCPICRALDGQTKEYNEYFEAIVNGKQYRFKFPLAHKYCRCAVIFQEKEGIVDRLRKTLKRLIKKLF